MKRIFLFLITNLLVMFSLMIAANLISIFLGAPLREIFGDYEPLVVFAFVFGMGGAFISLLLSKTIVKFSTGAQVIDGSEGEAERWLVSTVEDLSRRANVRTPEVAIYEGDANAFATGAFKNSSLVAVSIGIMRQMTREELRAVLGHEMSHVANGDMVTMTLVQGVLNSMVIFLAHVLAVLADNAMRSGERGRRRGGNFFYYIIYHTLHTLLGLLAALLVAAYSRRREFAADKGSAMLLGSPSSMIAALRRLGNLQPGVLPDSLKAFGIASGKSHVSLFATHPSLEARIEALQNLTHMG